MPVPAGGETLTPDIREDASPVPGALLQSSLLVPQRPLPSATGFGSSATMQAMLALGEASGGGHRSQTQEV